jgi:DNA-binding CsgD family transcriptional regulator
LGKQYTKEEINQIQVLTNEGLTDGQIATRLNRSENAIRNLRHRTKLKTETKQTIESLKRDRRTLNKKVRELRWEVSSLQTRKEEVSKALHIEELTLYQRLYTALQRMKDQKPELFQITIEEQIAKITVLLGSSFVKWLFSE